MWFSSGLRCCFCTCCLLSQISSRIGEHCLVPCIILGATCLIRAKLRHLLHIRVSIEIKWVIIPFPFYLSNKITIGKIIWIWIVGTQSNLLLQTISINRKITLVIVSVNNAYFCPSIPRDCLYCLCVKFFMATYSSRLHFENCNRHFYEFAKKNLTWKFPLTNSADSVECPLLTMSAKALELEDIWVTIQSHTVSLFGTEAQVEISLSQTFCNQHKMKSGKDYIVSLLPLCSIVLPDTSLQMELSNRA